MVCNQAEKGLGVAGEGQVSPALNSDEVATHNDKATQNTMQAGIVEIGNGMEMPEGVTGDRLCGYLHVYDISMTPHALKRYLMITGSDLNVNLRCLSGGVVEEHSFASFMFKTHGLDFVAYMQKLKSEKSHFIIEGFAQKCGPTDDQNSDCCDADDIEDASTSDAEDSDIGDSEHEDSEGSAAEGFNGF